MVTGTLVESKGKGQSTEIQAENVEVVGWVEDPETYPIQPKAHSFEYLREVVHEGCPDAEETMKWSMPHFTHHGMLAGMSSFKAHCAFTIHGDGRQGAEGSEGMGSCGKIASLEVTPPTGGAIDGARSRSVPAASSSNGGSSKPSSAAYFFSISR